MTSNPSHGASPERLAEWPELASLEIAEAAANTATRAILASLPPLEEPDFLREHNDVTPQLCLAAALLSALDAVAVAAERYRVHLDYLAAARHRHSASHSF